MTTKADGRELSGVPVGSYEGDPSLPHKGRQPKLDPPRESVWPPYQKQFKETIMIGLKV